MTSTSQWAGKFIINVKNAPIEGDSEFMSFEIAVDACVCVYW